MEKTQDRELRITKIFRAPVELMWAAWSKPEHVAQWWGPNGFTTTIHQMDFREGGEWKLTMLGPDGKNYPNRSVFKEIIPLKKIVFEHDNPHFITTVLFESRGEETHINWTMLFDTADLKEIVIKAHRADEGLKQNIEKLSAYLAEMSRTPAS